MAFLESGWADLNRRPLVPQTSTLNPCATARMSRDPKLSEGWPVVNKRTGLRGPIGTDWLNNWLIRDIIDTMKTISVGAFEAKTHFSQLLTEVEKGAEVRITRHGKPVAIMRREDGARVDAARGALARLAVNRTEMTREEIASLIESGRER